MKVVALVLALLAIHSVAGVTYSPTIPGIHVVASYEPASGGSLLGGLYYNPDGAGTTNVRPYGLAAVDQPTTNVRVFVSMSNGNQDTGAMMVEPGIGWKDANFTAVAEGGQCITLMDSFAQEYYTQLLARLEIAGVDPNTVQRVHFMNLFCGMGNTYTNTMTMISDFSSEYAKVRAVLVQVFPSLKIIYINDLTYHGYHPDGNHAYDHLYAYRQAIKDTNTVTGVLGGFHLVHPPMTVWLNDNEIYDPADAPYYVGANSRAESPTNVHESPPGCGAGFPECSDVTVWGEYQMGLKLKAVMTAEGVYVEDATIGHEFSLITGQPVSSWSWNLATVCPTARYRRILLRTDPSTDDPSFTVTRGLIQKSSHVTRWGVIAIDVNNSQWGNTGSITTGSAKALIGGKVLCRA